jgi:inositol oxygenase
MMRRSQTVEFVKRMEEKWVGGFGTRGRMNVREAFEALGSYVDSSDPDSGVPNFEHSLQTAEAIRAKGLPDWFVLVGLIHDMYVCGIQTLLFAVSQRAAFASLALQG